MKLLISLILIYSIVLFSGLFPSPRLADKQETYENKVYTPKFKRGECIQKIEEKQEEWVTPEITLQKVLQVGNKHYLLGLFSDIQGETYLIINKKSGIINEFSYIDENYTISSNCPNNYTEHEMKD